MRRGATTRVVGCRRSLPARCWPPPRRSRPPSGRRSSSTKSPRCRTASRSCSKKIIRRRSCTCNLTYHVGSKNEKPGRTGFAHLFEHLMFKGSKNVDPEGHTSMIASIGGQSNAFTTEDETTFWETAPSQYLPMLLWLEGDRMATLRINNETFTNEREVVKEERRLRDRQPAVRPAQRDHLRPGVHDASVQAPADRQHGGSRRRERRRRARLLPHVLRAGERDADARRRHRSGAGAAAGHAVPRPRAESREARAARHPEGAAADGRASPHAADAMAASGRRRGVSHHLRRQSGFVSAAHRRQGAVRRPELAHSAEAGVRTAGRRRGVRRSESHRGSEPVLRRRDRSARAHARAGDQRAHRRVRPAEEPSRSPTASCSAPRTSSRAITSSGANPIRKRRASSLTPSSSITTSRPPTASSTSFKA